MALVIRAVFLLVFPIASFRRPGPGRCRDWVRRFITKSFSTIIVCVAMSGLLTVDLLSWGKAHLQPQSLVSSHFTRGFYNLHRNLLAPWTNDTRRLT